jgi:hypothetical protein
MSCNKCQRCLQSIHLPKSRTASGAPAKRGHAGEPKAFLSQRIFAAQRRAVSAAGPVLCTTPQRARKKTKREKACWAAGAQRLVRVASPTVYFLPISFSSRAFSFLSFFAFLNFVLSRKGGDRLNCLKHSYFFI